MSSRIDDAEDLQGVRLALASINEARKAGGWGRSEPCRIEKIMHRVLDKQEGEGEGLGISLKHIRFHHIASSDEVPALPMFVK